MIIRHLDTLFLGIDGCFKTKLKDRKIADPDLGTGLAYMVNDVDYATHLEETAEEVVEAPVSVCLTSYHFPIAHPLDRRSHVALTFMQ